MLAIRAGSTAQRRQRATATAMRTADGNGRALLGARRPAARPSAPEEDRAEAGRGSRAAAYDTIADYRQRLGLPAARRLPAPARTTARLAARVRLRSSPPRRTGPPFPTSRPPPVPAAPVLAGSSRPGPRRLRARTASCGRNCRNCPRGTSCTRRRSPFRAARGGPDRRARAGPAAPGAGLAAPGRVRVQPGRRPGSVPARGAGPGAVRGGCGRPLPAVAGRRPGGGRDRRPPRSGDCPSTTERRPGSRRASRRPVRGRSASRVAVAGAVPGPR